MLFNSTIRKNLGDAVYIAIFWLLYSHPEGFTGREIASLVKVSPAKANQVLNRLGAQGILLKTVVGRAHRYRLNREHILVSKVISYLINFESLLFSNIGMKIMSSLSPKPLSVILYGSIARGDESADSDIDLLIINGKKLLKSRSKQLDGLRASMVADYGNVPNFMEMDYLDFQNRLRKKDSLARAILRDGKVIAGKTLMEISSYGR